MFTQQKVLPCRFRPKSRDKKHTCTTTPRAAHTSSRSRARFRILCYSGPSCNRHVGSQSAVRLSAPAIFSVNCSCGLASPWLWAAILACLRQFQGSRSDARVFQGQRDSPCARCATPLSHKYRVATHQTKNGRCLLKPGLSWQALGLSQFAHSLQQIRVGLDNSSLQVHRF
jgi:hypothetical protein